MVVPGLRGGLVSSPLTVGGAGRQDFGMAETRDQVDEGSGAQGPEVGDGSTAAGRAVLPQSTVWALAVLALVGVLVAVNLRRHRVSGSSAEGELRELQAKVNAAESKLNARRSAMEPVEDVAARLKQDAETMVALARTLQTTIAEKESLLAAKHADVQQSEQLRKAAVDESRALREQLGKVSDGGAGVEAMRRELEGMRPQRDALAAEVAKLKQELQSAAGGASAEIDDLKRQLAESRRERDFFAARTKELEAGVAKERLFADSENELSPEGLRLLRSLRELEGKPDAEITAAYAGLGVSLGANALQKFEFAGVSGGLTPEFEEKVKSLASEVADGDSVVVVGYAAEGGDAEASRKLSAERATAVAELFSSVKRAGQQVQAVHFGSTDRFSSQNPERNQIVEIWRVRKK